MAEDGKLDIEEWKQLNKALLEKSTTHTIDGQEVNCLTIYGSYMNFMCRWHIDINKFMKSLMHQSEWVGLLWLCIDEGDDIEHSLNFHLEQIYDDYVDGIRLDITHEQ